MRINQKISINHPKEPGRFGGNGSSLLPGVLKKRNTVDFFQHRSALRTLKDLSQSSMSAVTVGLISRMLASAPGDFTVTFHRHHYRSHPRLLP